MNNSFMKEKEESNTKKNYLRSYTPCFGRYISVNIPLFSKFGAFNFNCIKVLLICIDKTQ